MEVDLSSSSDEYASKCSTCLPRRAAKVFCLQCEQYFCFRCKRTHNKSIEKSNHFLLQGLDVPGSVTRKALHTRTLEFCHKHPKQIIQRYCITHELLCCESCAKEGHLRCHTEPVDEDDFQRSEEKLSYLKDELNERIVEFKHRQNHIQNERGYALETKDHVKKQVEEYFQEMIAAINERKDAVLKQIDGEFSTKQESCLDQSLSDLMQISKTIDDPSLRRKTKARQLEELNIISDQIQAHKKKLDCTTNLRFQFQKDEGVLETIKLALGKGEFLHMVDDKVESS